MSTRRRTSASTLPRLLLRQFASGIRASLVLAVLVILVAATATGVPRLIQTLFTESIQYRVGTLTAPQRDLVASAIGTPEPGPSDRPSARPLSSAIDTSWGRFDDGVAALRASLPQPLLSNVGPAEYALVVDPAPALPPDPTLGKPKTLISLAFDPRISTRIDFVAGSAPKAPPPELSDGDPVDIALSSASAGRLDWAIGEIRVLSPRFQESVPLRLSGIFEAKDPGDPYWEHSLSTLQPTVMDGGLGLPTVLSVAYADPTSWTMLPSLMPLSHLNLWLPVSTKTLDSSTAQSVATEVRALASRAHPLARAGDGAPGTIAALSFHSQLPATLDAAFASNAATSAVLATVAVGPLGVVLVVLALGARLLVNRRSRGLVILAARGATRAQLRWMLGLEGLLLGLPAAAIGAVVGLLLTPGRFDAAELIPAVVAGIVPAILLASSANEGRMRRGRSDSDLAPTARFRWVAELAVVIVTAAALAALVQRGPVAATGVDPLLAATPLLLALTACVVVMRLYPLPLARLTRLLHTRRSLSGFLGAARALRDPAAGLAPILAIIVGISVTAFSGVMLSTLHAGIDTTARTSVGADLLVKAPAITETQLRRIAALPEVAASAPLYADVWSIVTVDRQQENASVLVVDVRDLRKVQADVPGAISLPRRLEQTGTGKIPAVASTDLARLLGPDSSVEAGFHPVTVVGTSASDTPLNVLDEWLIIDRANAKAILGEGYSPSLVLLDLKQGADVADASKKIGTILGADTTITSPTDAAAGLNANPTVSGLQFALLAAILIAGLLCAAAIAMALALATPARERTFAILRAFGLSRGDARALVGWEIGPVAAVAILIGVLLGISLPLVVLAGVDLRTFTGGMAQPGMTLDPWLLALVIGGFLLVLGVATTITLATARRVSSAGAVRSSEEG